MAKTKISEFSSTPANNTDIDSINIAEGCAPSGINDAIRELMAQLKDFQTGAQGDSFNGPIGTSTAAAGAFTTLSATGAITSTLATGTAPLVIASTTKVANLNVDLLDGADWASPAALGSTTPAAVSATTLSASSTVTLSGGTANGVAYLNGSKVVTSGSALTFNGTTQFTYTSSSDASFDIVASGAGTAGYLGLTNAGSDTQAIGFKNGLRFGSATGTGGAGFSELMRLTSTGLGIGTSSPSLPLSVYKASDTTFTNLPANMVLHDSTAMAAGVGGGIWFGGRFTTGSESATTFAAISGIKANGTSTDTAGELVFGVRDSSGGTTIERMRLTSTGLGIGTSSPSAKLQVVSTGAASIIGSSGASNVYSQWNYNASAIGYLGNGAAIVSAGAATDFALGATNKLWMVSGAGSQYAVLDSSGNLGLGVTPSAWDTYKALQINNGSVANYSPTQDMRISSNAYYNAGWKYIASAYGSQYLLDGSNGSHQWFTAPSGTAGNAITFTQAATITANGNYLLGTTTDVSTVRMQVWSSSSDNTAYFRNSSATPYGPSIKYTAATPNNTGSEFLFCEDSTALRVSLRSNGGIANYSANDVNLSDVRTKTDIQDAGGYLAKICAIPVRTFKYKDQTDNLLNLGVIAQEVEAVAPELVDVSGFGEIPNDGIPLKAIYQTDMQYALMKALQELKAEFDAYKATHP